MKTICFEILVDTNFVSGGLQENKLVASRVQRKHSKDREYVNTVSNN